MVSEASTEASPEFEYAELKRRVAAAGLLQSQPAYYRRTFVLAFALYAVAFVVVITSQNVLALLIGAALAAVAFTQMGLLGHDLGHMQVLRGSRLRAPVSLIVGNLMIGVSYSWWATKHNQHHAHPNDLALDPDLNLPSFAFASSQVEGRSWLFRKMVVWQAVYFWMVIPLQSVTLRFQTIVQLVGSGSARRNTERVAFAGHIALYLLLLVAIGSWPLVIAFTLVHQGLFGVYNSVIFAPNHKGMPLIEAGSGLGFLREQVLTARNVRGHWLTDFVYGGLNYQIEHHLFPAMSRNQLHRAQPIVKAFCAERGISYCETGLLESYRMVITGLHEAPQNAPPGQELAPDRR